MLEDKERAIVSEVLAGDGVVAFVTDTVWGIGCRPESERAVKRIYEIKHRDGNKPLILMSYDCYPLLKYVKPLCKKAHELMKTHFPGALTLVVEKSGLTPDYLTSGFSTVGVRVPDNEVFGDICRCVEGGVLATTSANISACPAALSYEEAVRYIGDRVDYVVSDYGLSAKGTASTVVGVSDEGIKIFRQGDIVVG